MVKLTLSNFSRQTKARTVLEPVRVVMPLERTAAKVKVYAKMKRQNYNVMPSEKQGTRKPYPCSQGVN
jgi:hypothetical protein